MMVNAQKMAKTQMLLLFFHYFHFLFDVDKPVLGPKYHPQMLNIFVSVMSQCKYTKHEQDIFCKNKS